MRVTRRPGYPRERKREELFHLAALDHLHQTIERGPVFDSTTDAFIDEHLVVVNLVSEAIFLKRVHLALYGLHVR
jgi:hypothetical protein